MGRLDGGEWNICARPIPDLRLIETWGPLTAGAIPEEGTKGLQLKENSSDCFFSDLILPV